MPLQPTPPPPTKSLPQPPTLTAKWFSAVTQDAENGVAAEEEEAAAAASTPGAHASSSTSKASSTLGGWHLTWDPAKITVAAAVADDQLFLRNVALGLIVTGKVWPVVLAGDSDDSGAAVHPDAHHRTVAFLRRAVRDPAALLGPLDQDQRCGVAVSVRDLWLACERRLFDDPAELADMRSLAAAMIDVLEDSFLPRVSVAHIHVSFFPRRACRVLRFAPVRSLEEVLGGVGESLSADAAERNGAGIESKDGPDGDGGARPELLFAEHTVNGVDGAEPVYFTWIDSTDLSYHNFESILPLDRILRRSGSTDAESSPFVLNISNPQRLHPQMEVFSCTLSGGDLPLLYQLDKLDLYLEPANSGQRGGKRMIFSSHALACGLTEAIRESTLFEVMMGDGEVGESEDERKSESEASPASNYHSDEPSEDGGKDDHDVSAIAHSPVDFELALSENGDSSKAGRVAEGSVNGKSESSVGDTLGESVASLSLNDDEMNKCESQQRNSETTAEDELEKESEADSESPSRYDSDSESSSSQSHHFGFPRNEAAWATSKRFRSVNFVFRLNKFEPTDGRFRLHRDTPYFDGAKNHVSKYTVLIYLSQGESANGSLTIYDCNDTRQKQGDDGDELRKCVVQNIASAQCIIFDQRYPHEGHPFEDGKKIFLRTELIFECPRFVRHEPQIGSLFSSAVYYTLESALDSQFARHADVLYEKANRAHWGLPVAKENGVGDLQDNSAGPMLFKKWRSLKFATDGSTFWFPTPHSMKGNIQEGASPSVLQQELEAFVKECAVVVVLDFFNGKLSETGKAFRKACQSTSASPPKELTAARLDKWVFDELERSDAYWQIDPSASSRSTSAVSNPAPPIVNARDRRSHGASGRFRESADEGSAKPLIPSSGADKKSLLYEYERNSTWWKYNSLSSDVRTEEDRLQALETMVKSYNREAVEYYLEEFEDSIQKLETPALILLLGSRFTFDPDDLAVCANAVKFRGAFGGDSGVPRFNFAAYEYDYDPLNDIAKKTAGWRIVVKGLPPLPFVFVAGRGGDGMPLGVRFRAEFFKNDWAVDVAEKPLHVPVYS